MIEKAVEISLGENQHLPLNRINNPGREDLIKESALKLLSQGYERLKKHYSNDIEDDEVAINARLRYSLRGIETDFIVNAEASNDNLRVGGRTDIKFEVSSWKKHFTFECKRLDGKSGYSGKYIKKGLIRFCDGQYCVDFDGNVMNPERSPNFAGMIGYVLKGEMSSIVEDIKNRTKNASFNKNGRNYGQMSKNSKYLLSETVPPFDYSFKSKHERILITGQTIMTLGNIKDILIYHVFFDLT